MLKILSLLDFARHPLSHTDSVMYLTIIDKKMRRGETGRVKFTRNVHDV